MSNFVTLVEEARISIRELRHRTTDTPKGYVRAHRHDFEWKENKWVR